MKVAVSIPSALFARADDAAAHEGLNRSQFYARAIEELVRRLGEDPVVARLNELAGDLAAPDGAASARRLIDTGAWEW